jgi:hypothetical protein
MLMPYSSHTEMFEARQVTDRANANIWREIALNMLRVTAWRWRRACNGRDIGAREYRIEAGMLGASRSVDGWRVSGAASGRIRAVIV